MKIKVTVTVLALLLCTVLAVTASAQVTDDQELLYLLGSRASEVAMKDLPFEKDDPNILVMTSASYAIIDGHNTDICIDGVADASGCTVGKGNLLLIHRSREKPLWFAFFSKNTNECVYLQVNNAVLGKSVDEFNALADEEVFTKITKANIGADKLLSEPEAWDEKMKAQIFGGGAKPFNNEFTIMTIANIWAKGAPPELIRANQFHNHLCPGSASGFLFVKYIDFNLPLEKPSQRYQIIAIKPWCKDDIMQWILEATIGNKNYIAKDLTPEQIKQLPEDAKDVANVVIRWDSATGTGKGMVIAWDWDNACQMCGGVSKKDLTAFDTHRWWWMRLKMNQWMLDYTDSPETLIHTVKEFDVDSLAELNNLKSAGVNPLVELGVMPKPETTPTSAEETPAIPGLGVIAAIAIAGALVYVVRRKA
ncbi:MAG: FmdE family protein [Euryarchaeota archaeon]|nr:FmdE family protein [Euryarchaeota archaeon]